MLVNVKKLIVYYLQLWCFDTVFKEYFPFRAIKVCLCDLVENKIPSYVIVKMTYIRILHNAPIHILKKRIKESQLRFHKNRLCS